MSLILSGLVVAFFTAIGYWRQNALLFMLAAGASIMVGFKWYDSYTTAIGMTAGLVLIANSLVCLGFAFSCIFRRETE